MSSASDRIPVYRLPDLGDDRSLATTVWFSVAALKVIEEYGKKENPKGRFLKKLKRYAQNGFESYVGKDKPIQHEWDQVYRISDGSSLFRLIGFFVPGSNEFVIIDGFVKRGTELQRNERDRIDAVSKVRASGAWTRIAK